MTNTTIRRTQVARARLPVTLLAWTTTVVLSHADLRVYRAVYSPGPISAEAALDNLSGAALMEGFTNSASVPAEVQTRAAIFQTGKGLRFIVECLEPQIDQIPAACTQRDGDVFADDCVEVFLAPARNTDEYYHFATNALGTRFDEEVHNRAWNPSWDLEVTRAQDRWRVDMTVPFAELSSRPGPGAVWWFNVCRQRHKDTKLELSAWSPTGDNFHNVLHFAALVFSDDYAQALGTSVLEPAESQVERLRARARVAPEAEARLGLYLEEATRLLAPVRDIVGRRVALSTPEFARNLEVGLAVLDRLDEAQHDVENIVVAAERTRQLQALARPGQALLVWATRAITNTKVLPTPNPPEQISRVLSLRACRGEYEPASFVVYPLSRNMKIEVRVTDLRGPAGVIPAAAVDVRAVKCWYQSGGSGRFPINQHLRLLTPELLLKDDDLVRVDYEKKENYVRLTFPDGSRKWLWISSPTPTPEEKDVSVEAMPIRDARELQPVRVPARKAKQFWVTVKVPADAKSGRYAGDVELWSLGRRVEILRLELEVLPFDLAPNPLESSIYFHWGITIDEQGQGSVAHSKRTWAQYRAELENLLAHGVNNPTLGVRFNTGLLPKALELRREVGLRCDNLYYLIAPTSAPTEEIKEIISIAKQYGYENVYFYGRDEARGEALRAQRPDWERVHAAGGKVFVAGSAGHNFPDMGDLQDLLVCYGDPSKDEAALWHSKGHKIFCYANPQSGIEEPETYRRNFGLLLGVNGYDGGMTYIYYHGWNDFSGERYRQHNFVYPTADGVIDTVQWEGYREGIDDLRYWGTLRQAIDEAEKSGGKAAALAAQARAFLGMIDVTGDLYAVRDEMIRWILALREATR